MKIFTFKEIKNKLTKELPDYTCLVDFKTYNELIIIIKFENNKSWGFCRDSLTKSICGVQANNQCSTICHFWSSYYSPHEIDNVIIKLQNEDDVLISDLQESFEFLLINWWNEDIKYLFKFFYNENIEFIKDVFINFFSSTHIRRVFSAICTVNYHRDKYSDDDQYNSISSFLHISKKNLEYLIKNKRFDYNLDYRKIAKILPYYTKEEQHKYFPFFCNCLPNKIFTNKKVMENWYNLEQNGFNHDFKYQDCLKLYCDLPKTFTKNINIYVKSDLEIETIHTHLINIYNTRRDEVRLKSIIEKTNKYLSSFYNKAKEFEYSDNNYSIIACKDLLELETEGKSLHHCVGGYIDSVSEGNEYILFLRKNEDLTKPFYTIDITPNKKVRQIHGLCNCNVTSDILPFINDWINKFKLDGTNYSGVKAHL